MSEGDLFDIPDSNDYKHDQGNGDLLLDTNNDINMNDSTHQDDMELDNNQEDEDAKNEDEDEEEEEEEEEEGEEEEDEEEEEGEDEEEDEEDEDDDNDNEDGKFMDAEEKFTDSKDDIPNAKPSDLNKEKTIDIDTKEDQKNDEAKQQLSNNQEVNEEDIEMDEIDKNEEENGKADDNEEPEKSEQSKTLTPLEFRQQTITKAKIATVFDIVPSVAIPYTSQCHSLAFTSGPKWILTGGEDGFIRKYDFFQSIEGKSPLTMAQRHNLVDSITKAGVISSYWENEQPLTKSELMKLNPKLKQSDFITGSVSYEPKINPVYSLDVEKNGFWCLSGLLSGGISLYTMIYNEGFTHHYFNHGERKRSGPTLDNGHNDAVSVITLNSDEKKFLSGSWDKSIRQWDLNSGKCVTLFSGSSSQISKIQYRPQGLEDVLISVNESMDNLPSGLIINQSNGTTQLNPDNNLSSKLDSNNNNSDVDSLFGDDDEEDDQQKEKESLDKQNSSLNKTPNITTKTYSNDDIFMSSSVDGTINIWDARISSAVLRIGLSEGTPPWCMSSCWSNDGEYIYAGRRNSTVEEFSIRMPHKRSHTGQNKDTMVPNVLKLLQFPKISGPVSAISTMPNNDFLLCGSNDNIRLYNLQLYDSNSSASNNKSKQATPFLIIPGHHGGILSHLYCDETGRFMVSASGNRGWGHSTFTDTVLVYEIDFEN